MTLSFNHRLTPSAKATREMITAFFPLHPYLILPNNIAPYVTHAIKEKIALWFHIIVDYVHFFNLMVNF